MSEHEHRLSFEEYGKLVRAAKVNERRQWNELNMWPHFVVDAWMKQFICGVSCQKWASHTNLLPEIVLIIIGYCGETTHCLLKGIHFPRVTTESGDVDILRINRLDWDKLQATKKHEYQPVVAPVLETHQRSCDRSWIAVSHLNVGQAPGPWLLQPYYNSWMCNGIIGKRHAIYVQFHNYGCNPGIHIVVDSVHSSYHPKWMAKPADTIWEMHDCFPEVRMFTSCDLESKTIRFYFPDWNKQVPQFFSECVVPFPGTNEELGECRPFISQWSSYDNKVQFDINCPSEEETPQDQVLFRVGIQTLQARRV